MATLKNTETQTLTNYEIHFQRTKKKKKCCSMKDTKMSQLSSWSKEKWSSKNLGAIND